MALLSDYTAGTVSVAANGTTVTGTGTAWQTAGFQEGDWFIANGFVSIIAAVNSNTSLTLVSEWQGGALSGSAYRLRYMSDGSRASAQARALIDLLSTHAFFQYDASGTLAERDNYDAMLQGFSYLDTSADPAALYVKASDTSGDWAGPFAYAQGEKGETGDQGPQGPKGDTGETGPANSLSIGTVEDGATAGATITGTAPSQTLNLVLPKGEKGEKGDKGDPGSGSVDSVNGDPGPDIVLTLDDIGDGTTNKAFTATEKTKLAGIEAGADVTDATNVAANLPARLTASPSTIYDDFNDIPMEAGWYRAANDAANSPGSGFRAVLSLPFSSTAGAQIATSVGNTNPKLSHRTYNNTLGGWSQWVDLGGGGGGNPEIVVDLAALKALDTGTYTKAQTKDDFAWSFEAGDYSGLVAADTIGGKYAKADAVAATSGAWVRRVDTKLYGKDFGIKADSDGTAGNGTDHGAALQVMADIAKAQGGGEIHLPAHPKGLSYRFASAVAIDSDNVQIIGEGQATKLFFDHAGDALELGVTTYIRNFAILGCDVRNTSVGGNIFKLTGGLVYGLIDECYVRQANPAKALMFAAHNTGSFQTIESVFQNSFFDATNTHAASIIDFSTTLGARFQGLRFEGLRVHTRGSTSADFAISIVNTGPNGLCGNAIRDITVEQTAGGFLRMNGCENARVENITVYDMGTVTTHKNIMQIVGGTNNKIANYFRTQGTLGSGLYDCFVTGGITNSHLENFSARSSATSPCAVNCGSQAVTLLNVQGAINTTNATIIA